MLGSSKVHRVVLVIGAVSVPFPAPFSMVHSPVRVDATRPTMDRMAAVVAIGNIFSMEWFYLWGPVAVVASSEEPGTVMEWHIVSAVFFLPSSPSHYVSSDLNVTVMDGYVVVRSMVCNMVFDTGASVYRGSPPIVTSAGPGPSTSLLFGRL